MINSISRLPPTGYTICPKESVTRVVLERALEHAAASTGILLRIAWKRLNVRVAIPAAGKDAAPQRNG